MRYPTEAATERTDDGDGEIDLVALWRVIWNYRYLLMLTTVVCTALGIVYALTATPKYLAEVVVAQAQSSGMSGASSLASQLGSLAGLAGVSLGGDPSARDSVAVLKSRRIVEEFITRNELMPELFRDSKRPPSLWRAVLKVQDSVLEIREDKRAGTIGIAIEWSDAATAANWANGFVTLANDLMRARALDDAARSIEYLNKQIAQTNVVEMQRVMYNLIESETKTLMLANARAEYAFKVIDPAVAPEFRTSPRRKVIVLGSAALGAFIGILIAFGHSALRRRNTVKVANQPVVIP